MGVHSRLPNALMRLSDVHFAIDGALSQGMRPKCIVRFAATYASFRLTDARSRHIVMQPGAASRLRCARARRHRRCAY